MLMSHCIFSEFQNGSADGEASRSSYQISSVKETSNCYVVLRTGRINVSCLCKNRLLYQLLFYSP